ncbi:MAG: hypothetical protein QMD71_01330 [bacterium]|nr:hypothetical protein [bacterium]
MCSSIPEFELHSIYRDLFRNEKGEEIWNYSANFKLKFQFGNQNVFEVTGGYAKTIFDFFLLSDEFKILSSWDIKKLCLQYKMASYPNITGSLGTTNNTGLPDYSLGVGFPLPLNSILEVGLAQVIIQGGINLESELSLQYEFT